MNYITKPRQPAGLKKSSRLIRAAFKNECGGGLGAIFIGLALLLAAISIFINILDYSIYTYKRNAISKAMDYAVTTAVQQVSYETSRDGLSDGFTETTGRKSLQDVKIDTDMAEKTFLSVLSENCPLDGLDVRSSLLICTTFTSSGKLNYSIKTSRGIISQGIVDSPSQVEERINQAIGQNWMNPEETAKANINQNPDTNMIENGTYLFVFLKGIRVSGIYSKRHINLSSLAGAKIER